ncbi:MAG: D-inositol-3-phosphate glycosyltransferase [Candidatus Omnitrophica bacterium]|nr:D-inositol-3-phosphate glycosyltransferase [Candidatus Omnitrophota bacterium]
MTASGHDVLVDARMWGHPGIGRYVRELTGAMGRSGGSLGLGYILPSSIPPPGASPVVRCDRPIYDPREQFDLPRLSRSWRLLHSPHFNAPIFGRTPLVVTIHDLIYVTEPGAAPSAAARLYADALLASAVKRARRVIAVSEATRRDIVVRYGADERKIRVIHEAASGVFGRAAGGAPAEGGGGRKYVLFVGTLKPHKNPLSVTRALQALRRRGGPDVDLVIAGKIDPRHRALADAVLGSQGVRYAGAVSDEELVRLYRGAEALVQPSFKEGFGLPVLEAMSCGTPVIAADRSSLPEVGGEAAQYFDPSQIDALERVLYNVLTDAKLRKDMSEKGIRRSETFTWQRTAERTVRVYEEALS